MSRKILYALMIVPVIAATWRSFGSETPVTLAPEQVVSWTAIVALQNEQPGVEVTDAVSLTDLDHTEG